MASLARSSSVFPLPVTGLTHSVNNSGRMGFFVDPQSCSCAGCADYCCENSAATEEALGPTESLTESQSPPPPSVPLVFKMGFPLRPAAAAAEAVIDPLSLGEETANSLRLLRARLQSRQDAVYEGETRSHDEMAAQDAEWEELDNQIHAIEQLLSSFRAIFRHR